MRVSSDQERPKLSRLIPKYPKKGRGVNSTLISLGANTQFLSPQFLLRVSVHVTFSSASDRETPSLSHASTFLTKQLRSPQLKLLFHKDLLGGADGKNGSYVAKKNYTGCHSKFTLVATSSVRCFHFSSASMLLKYRCHFKTRF